MNRWGKIVIGGISLLWMLSIVALYFFNIQVTDETCLPNQNFCLSLNSTKVNFSWRPSHLYYKKAVENMFHNPSFSILEPSSYQTNPLISIIVAVTIIYLLIVTYQRFVKGKRKLSIIFSPFSILLLFSLIFFVTSFNWFSFFNYLDLSGPYTNIFIHYSFIVFALLFITLICTSMGSFALRMGRQYQEEGEAFFLLSFGIGAFIAVFMLFFLGVFRMLVSPIVWGMFCLGGIITYKEVYIWIKRFFTSSISLDMGYFSIPVFLMFLLLIIISHNVLELIRPMPIGFDDLGLYMNIPKLLRNGALISGINSYSWGLFMSLGFLLFNSPMLALFLSFLGGLFVILIIHQLIKKYGEERGFPKTSVQTFALLGATLFYSLPSVVFQSAKDMKVDLAAVFFALLSMMILWNLHRENQVRYFKKIFLGAILIGFAFTIKYNLFLFALVLMFYVLVSSWSLKSGKKILLSLTIFLLGFGAPFFPYALKNVIETRDLSIASISMGKSEAPVMTMNPPVTTDIAPRVEPPQTTGVREEQGRYAGYGEGVIKYLLLPFTATFNSIVSGMYVDIGFIFLSLVPLAVLLYYFIPRDEKREKRLPDIAFMGAIIYWSLWILFAQGIIWYGYAGFMFLLIIIVEILYLSQKHYKVIWLGSVILITGWLLCALVVRAAYLPPAMAIDRTSLLYARGTIDEQMYFDQKIPYLSYIKRMNEDIDSHPDHPPKVYRVGTFMKYFIEQNNITVLDDNQLDIFSWIHQDNDDSKTIQRFKNSGFTYLLIDTNTPTIDKTPEKSLTAKYKTFMQFIQNNPSSIEILLDQPESGIMIARFL